MSIVKKSITISVVLASVVTFTVFGFSNAHEASGEPTGEMVELVSPMFEDMSSTVMVPGSLQLVDKQVVTELAENGGFEVLVELGEEVEVGTPLVQYSTSELDFEMQDIQLQIDRTNATIAKLASSENEISKRKNGSDVKPTYSTDEETGEQTEIEPLVTVQELDQELAELADLKKEENYSLTRLANQLENVKEQKEALTVKSTIAGKVLKINDQEASSETDAFGNESNALLEIADTSKFTITGNISEKQSLEVEQGHPVTIYSDTVEDGFWDGEVIDVSYFPSESDDWYGDASGSQYPVTILITEGDTEKLRPGYQVFAEILTKEQTGLALTMDAIKYDDVSSYVLVYEGGIAVRKDVELGFSTEYSVEIVNGLSEDDQVILDYMDMITEGMEVEPFDYGEFDEFEEGSQFEGDGNVEDGFDSEGDGDFNFDGEEFEEEDSGEEELDEEMDLQGPDEGDEI